MIDTAAQESFPSAGAMKHLAELGVKATDAEIVDIPTEGFGEGLPPTIPAIFDRNEQKLSSVKALIEEYRLRPARRTGTAAMQTLSAFTELVKRHMDSDSAIFVDLNWKAPSFAAVIDYHKQDGTHEPRNLKHRINYAFPLSEEWKAWNAKNATPMGQGDFAAFIEDHIAELSAPRDTESTELEFLFKTRIADPAEIVQLSRGLAVSVDSKVARAVTLQTGEGEMVFTEVHKDGSGQKLVIPGVFMLSLPVFFRGEHVRIPARLRYRVKDGSVLWFFQLWRPDVYVSDAVARGRDAVTVETGLPIYEGSPEA